MREEEEADDDASDDVSHYDLEECEVRYVGETGNADDGECAGFGGNDGEGDAHQGYCVGKEVIA